MITLKRFFPSCSAMETRKWASNGLPKLITLGIGIHVFFTLALVNELHLNDGHKLKRKNLVLNNHNQDEPTRSRIIPRNYALQTLGSGNEDDSILEADDLYIEQLHDINTELQKALNVSASVSCRWRENPYSIYTENCDYHLKPREDGKQATIVVFNPLEHERILCDGSKIKPAEIRILQPGMLDCSEPPRLFKAFPSIQTKGELDPIDLRFRRDRQGRNTVAPNFPCDVRCIADQPMGVLGTRSVKGTPLKIAFSMEGPQYYKQLRYSPSAHRSHRYYSTTSFQSEIPLPYFSFEEYGHSIQAPAVDYDDVIKGAVFIARNCNSRNSREALVKSLIRSDAGLRVDSVSNCLHNAEIPHGAEDKRDIMRQYLFYLAFENQCEDDYITEKLWGTFASGVLPVYYGAPNIEDHVPPNSIINANSFNTTEDLAKYLVTVANNRTLYESYHKWRTQPLPDFFVRKYNMTYTHSTCRTCRWAAAKKYGFGWNHTEQQVEELRIPRKVCRDSHGVLTHPFRETWVAADEGAILLKPVEHNAQQSCETKAANFSTSIQIGNQVIERTVWAQDGVTDMYLEASTLDEEGASEGLVLRMDTFLDRRVNSTALKSHSTRHHRFQDKEKRMTVLTSRSTEVKTEGNGVLELQIPNAHKSIKIRIIVEDIEYYPDSLNRTNYFAQLLTEDFLNPLEKFVVWGSPEKENSWEGTEMLTVGLISVDDEEDGDAPDEEETEEMERKESIKKEVEAVRHSLIQIKDQGKEEADKKALDGVKKLIAQKIIKLIKTASDEEEDGAIQKEKDRLEAIQKAIAQERMLQHEQDWGK